MKRECFLRALFVICQMAMCQLAGAADNNDNFSGVVVETMDAGGYTYVRIDTGSEKIWAAGPTTVLKPGQQLSISRQMPMVNYHSKALARDFDVLYFVVSFNGEDAGAAGGSANPHASAGAQPELPLDLKFAKADGGKTIAEIIKQQKQLAGQPVSVRGQVVKYNQHILDRNWVHIRDSSGEQDLTITTAGTVALGDVILAKGKITLDKDFGSGYRYDVLMEEATITVESGSKHE